MTSEVINFQYKQLVFQNQFWLNKNVPIPFTTYQVKFTSLFP